MVVNDEHNMVAYATPRTPQPKTKIKIGSIIKFRIFVKIIIIEGVLEFPSACKVLMNKLEKRKTNEHRNIGVKYSRDKSMAELASIKIRISGKRNVDNIMTNPNRKQATIPCRIEL